MKAEHFLINVVFAKASGLPVSFNAIRAKETQKAVWVYGHGAMDPMGHCAACGQTLTHPGSILIGIGPECLNNWGARDHRLENMTEADKVYLKALVTDRRVDSWIPKSIIKKSTPIEEDIELPEAHKSHPVKLVGTPAGPRPSGPVDNDPEAQGLSKDTRKFKDVDASNAKLAREWQGQIAIQFPYSYATLTQVKSLEGRKWHSEGKYWTCPIGAYAVLKLREWGFEIDSKLAYIVDQTKGIVNKELGPHPSNAEVIDALSESIEISLTKSGIKRKLFPYQLDGVSFIHLRKGRALVADEMGLGKTIQALAYLQLHQELRPAVILCPASLKLNWQKEINLTMTGRTNTQILEGKTPHDIYGGQIVIINYDILPHWIKALQKIKPSVIIADECHYFKSNAAKRTKAVKLLAKGIPHFIALSGTPIVNRPIEIYNALSIINPRAIPGFWEYARRYCGAVHNGFGWDFTGASHTEELHKILTETIMIRRKKADVLKDLPDKIYSYVPMTLGNKSEYDSIERDVIGYLKMSKGQKAADRASNAEVVVQIELLKQAAVRGKLEACIDWIEDFLESGEKLIVFATHKFVIDRLMERFGDIAVKIDGSTSMGDRNKAVERFQGDSKIRVIFGNIKAAGVGLTLTAASNVAFIELPWTPGDLRQAEDRAHRIGQKFTVNVHYLLVEGTIESEIATLLDKKTKILDAVLDGKETQDDSLLSELINILTRKQELEPHKW